MESAAGPSSGRAPSLLPRPTRKGANAAAASASLRGLGAGEDMAMSSGQSRLPAEVCTFAGIKSEDTRQHGDSRKIGKTFSRAKREMEAKRQQHLKEVFAANQAALEAQTAHLLHLFRTRSSLAPTPPQQPTATSSVQVSETKQRAAGQASSPAPSEDSKPAQHKLRTVVSGSTGGRTLIKPTKLPLVSSIPPTYTTWIFTDRNIGMSEYGSIAGLKRLYYENNETLLVSDSEDESDLPKDLITPAPFSNLQCYCIWEVVKEHGATPEVFEALALRLKRESQGVEAQYQELLQEQSQDPGKFRFAPPKRTPEAGGADSGGVGAAAEEKQVEVCGWGAGLSLSGGVRSWSDVPPFPHSSLQQAMDSLNSLACRRCLGYDCRLHGANQPLITPSETPPPAPPTDDLNHPCGPHCYRLVDTSPPEPPLPTKDPTSPAVETGKGAPGVGSGVEEVATSVVGDGDKGKRKAVGAEAGGGAKAGGEWSQLEKDMYELAVKMLGPYSCRIARFLTSDRTCQEVHSRLERKAAIARARKAALDGTSAGTALPLDSSDDELTPRGRGRQDPRGGGGKKGRKRKQLKRGWTPGTKKLAGGLEKERVEFTPCECKGGCDPRTCPCFKAGTSCEKFCGCPQTCKLRWPGCRCKQGSNTCGTNQCPCFKADRECDPDVCRGCIVTCGDGTLPCGPPPPAGGAHGTGGCQNMKLLLKQHKRTLLGRSNVTGWGAFIKHAAKRGECLGEYTGEQISHTEADRRGKMYDKQNLSFLFNLNDRHVLDAGRRGNKLKFANHSPVPNCVAKIKLVSGDHRVGIYALDAMQSGEEIFYDYMYERSSAPAWAVSLLDLAPPKEKAATTKQKIKKAK